MIQTRDLEAFVHVMRLNSVSLAAVRLNITQSAVSRRLQGLEAALGQQLFQPHGRGIKPTHFATAFAEKAFRVHAAFVDLEQVDQATVSPVMVKIAATAQTIETLLAPILAHLDHKALRPVIIEAGGGQILSLVASGRCDAGITTDPPAGLDVMSQPIGTLRLRAFAAQGARRDRMDISELASKPVLCLDETYQTRQLFNAACRLAGFTPRIIYEGRSTRAILALAQAGMGVAVLPSNVSTDMAYAEVFARGDPLTLNQVFVWGQTPGTKAAIAQIRTLIATATQ